MWIQAPIFKKEAECIFSSCVRSSQGPFVWLPVCVRVCVCGWTHLSELLAGEVFQLRRVCDLVLSLVLALLPFVLQVGRNAAAEGEKGRKGWRRWDVTGEGGRWKGKTNKIKIKRRGGIWILIKAINASSNLMWSHSEIQLDPLNVMFWYLLQMFTL